VGDALQVADGVGYPVIVRPAFILGGGGTGIAHDRDQLRHIAERGLDASPISEILIERSVVGWKEYELEVMRDTADNVVVICSIENLDRWACTPASRSRSPRRRRSPTSSTSDARRRVRVHPRIGVETGGSNVQFAVDPAHRRAGHHRDEPARLRSSALASKATGFPDRKIAAKLAVGYRLDEVRNDITRETPGVVRTDDRLRRHQDPALGVREAAGLGAGARHADAVGRRGDGDRPHVPESLQKACARSRPAGSASTATRERELDCLGVEELVPAAAVRRLTDLPRRGRALRKFVSVGDRHARGHGDRSWFSTRCYEIGGRAGSTRRARPRRDHGAADWRPSQAVSASATSLSR
jgi:hypothetical protein